MAEPTTVAFKLNFDQLLSLAIKDSISEIWTQQKIWNISQLDRNLVYNIQTDIIKFMVSRENIKFKKKKKNPMMVENATEGFRRAHMIIWWI